ncbi:MULTISPECIES: AzlD domain-containing protein [Oceanobacillus]|uniref:AzlD domain-containing protein n=1 Tax=Oceanobacillus kimchii TaxID=746691 RepID=A0ABQ5TJ04_9BACI|nr:MULTISPECIES: AzlD domain-containing protein [Oceanobacillus]MBT2599172.1 AzlD domain-containing protein [Oceanobacillus sp. ISL-74]MBT2652090.1 AzlD domain-containing protein [Oceanobacillus sp. ISL-73]MCT1578628.1 AzlD domain-containing protein [Oceanobacillus kimchii]MCT2136323.1 AzlD domain-containing protein [Oceanobacillus kimchii]OEH54266.1 branched-chain amino acid transporter [Oceanobacillus sp. E9]
MIIAMILGMFIVTMLPRLIPVFIVEKVQFRPWVNRWLLAIPYAALGALIFPGVLSVVPDRPFVGLLGGLIAILLSLFGLNVVFVVIGSILSIYIMINL